MLFGPYPPETLRRKLDEAKELAKSSPRIEQACLFLEVSLASQRGDFATAWALYERADSILAQLDMKMIRYLMMDMAAEIALREGRPEEAAHILQLCYDGLGAVGATGFRSTVAIGLAYALYECGDLEEAERYAAGGEVMGGRDDITNFASGRRVRALVLADRGELAEAEVIGRSAVDYALETDFPRIQAEAFIALAHVLRLSGGSNEADSLVERAVALYESRGDVDAVSRVRR